MRYRLVMPAAGSGRRFGPGVSKQYMRLAGRTVMEWALAPFLEDDRCMQIVVALAPGDEAFDALPLAHEPRLSRVSGGAQRADSVAAALQSLAGADAAGADSEWVLVHDAARPCVTRLEVDSLLDSASQCAAGALLALPVADTLKRADADRLVVDTPSRDTLWRALTPQMFPRGLLRRALDAARQAGRTPTDEAQAVEWLGMRPLLVPGNPQNLKITHAGDLDIAAAILGGHAARRDART